MKQLCIFCAVLFIFIQANAMDESQLEEFPFNLMDQYFGTPVVMSDNVGRIYKGILVACHKDTTELLINGEVVVYETKNIKEIRNLANKVIINFQSPIITYFGKDADKSVEKRSIKVERYPYLPLMGVAIICGHYAMTNFDQAKDYKKIADAYKKMNNSSQEKHYRNKSIDKTRNGTLFSIAAGFSFLLSITPVEREIPLTINKDDFGTTITFAWAIR